MALTLLSFPCAPFSSSFSLPANSSIRCSLSFSKASMALCPSSSLLSSASAQLSFVSSFSGLSLGSAGVGHNKLKRDRNRHIQVRAGKAALACTKRSRSRKSLARVHGFRKRMQTPGGRKVLKRRRDKGRKVLCPKAHANSGKRDHK